MQESILILDFGSQFTQLIARRVRELNVYCEIHPYNKVPEITKDFKGVILSGSPHSVRETNAPQPDLKNIKGKLPLLGVCYGAQYLSHFFGGEVAQSNSREYGRAKSDALREDGPEEFNENGSPLQLVSTGDQSRPATRPWRRRELWRDRSYR